MKKSLSVKNKEKIKINAHTHIKLQRKTLKAKQEKLNPRE